MVKVHYLTRRQISTVDDIDWTIHIGKDSLTPSDPIRVRCRIYGWYYMPPAELSLGDAPNGNLDFIVNGTTIASGLGDGSEKCVYDEIITGKFPAGKNKITLHLSSGNPCDVSMEVEEIQ